MGIQGLLPLLKSIMVPIHIKDLEGYSVAVDTYSWLHKGALSCSRELCKGLPTSRHIEYCMHRVNLLRHYGVKPILVFDGGYLPMKADQENKRARIRKENFARAIEHESNGNSAAAYECYQKAVDISPSIAYGLIQVLKKENVSYVVAPYEADAQMTFLALSKQVDVVITEDSDLIPFGCPRIIFKMDKFGQGLGFQYSMLQQNKGLNFAGFTKQMLLEMCILSGCDYLVSLPGMGVKRAHALIKRFTNYEKVIKHLRYNTVSIPPLYEESLKKAILTFRHQRVYDPVTEDIVHLSSVVDDIGDDLDFLGPFIPQDTAKTIAEGDLNPITKMPFQEENVSAMNIGPFPVKSINLGIEKKRLDLPVQKNTLTKYFCFASIEAKRNFRAPQISPNNSSPSSNSSLISKEDVDVEHIATKMSCSETASLLRSKIAYPIPLPNDSAQDNLAAKVSESSASPSHDMKDILDETKSMEGTFLPQSRYPIHKPCLTLQRERESKNFSDAFEGKTRTDNRKVIIRSSYFQHKPSKENAEDSKQNIVTNNDCAIDLCGNTVSENVPYGNSYNNGKATKRRNPLDHCFEAANLKTKQVCVDASFSKSGSEEKKFGSNISHLGHYSEVAQKSVENFVSIISSFRYSSSGSRASGLRAPLKDIRNISTSRSTADLDLNQFVYVPKHPKT